MADQQINIPITPSEPPSVKLVAARGAAFQMVIAQFSEFAGLLAITYALCLGKLGEQTFAYLFLSCLFGRTAEKLGGAIRGKPVQLPTTTLIGVATALALAFAPGCAGTQLHEPDWAQVRQDANTMRTTVNDVVDEATQVGVPMMQGACAYWGERSVQCQDLRFTYELARQSVDAARKAIDAYDATGALGEQVHAAVDHAKALGGEFSDAAQAALEAVHHAVATQAPGPGDGGSEAAPPQARPGSAEGTGPPHAAAPANAAAAQTESAP